MSVKRKNIELDPEAFATAAIAQPDPVRVATSISALAPPPARLAPKERAARRVAFTQASRTGKVQVQAWVSEDTRRRLKVVAATTGGTVEQLLTGAIDDLLKRHLAI